MAYNAATLTFPHTCFVTRRFDPFDFTRPVRSGDIVKVLAQVSRVGTTSCTVTVWCEDAVARTPVFRTSAVMVNVGANGNKAAIPR
jgi:acyl-CoA hydrolase